MTWNNKTKHASSYANKTHTKFLIDSYSESNWEFSLDYLDSLDARKIGMNFTNFTTGVLDSCKFFLAKIGSPTGNIVAKLYAITGTYGVNSVPTGSALVASDNVNVATLHSAVDSGNLVASDYTLITFNFSTSYVMAINTHYVISLEYSGGGIGNYVSVGGGSLRLPTGNPVQDYGSGWVTYTGDAYNFYVYSRFTFNNKSKHSSTYTDKVKHA